MIWGGAGGKYVNSRDVARLAIRGSAALAAQTVLSRVAAALGLVVAARLVGPKEMAVWAIVSGMGSVGWTVADLGMAASLVRERAEPELLAFRQAGGLQVAVVLLLIAGVLAGWGAFASWFSWAPEMPSLILAVLAGMVLRGVATPTRARLERHLEFTSLALVQAVSSIAQSLILVLGLLMNAGVWAFAMSSVAADGVALIITRVVGGSRFLLPTFGIGALRPHLSFGLALQFHNIGHLARESLTPLVLTQVLGPEIAGLWAWIRKTLEVLYSFLSIGWRVTFPTYARLGSHAEWRKASSTILEVAYWPLLLVTVALLGSAPWALDAVFGAQWRDAHLGLYIALIALVHSGPVSVALAGGVLADGGAAKLAALQFLRTLTVWTVALWTGPHWGVTGVAIGWSCQLMEDALGLLFFARRWRPSLIAYTKGMISGAVASTIAILLRAGHATAAHSVVAAGVAALVVVMLNLNSVRGVARLARTLMFGGLGSTAVR